MSSYSYDEGRFPRLKRRDGSEQLLIPIPKCLRCSLPISPLYTDSGLCYFCKNDPIVDGIQLVRILAACLYIPKVTGYAHSAELLSLKSDGRFAETYADILKQVISDEIPNVRPSAIVPLPSARLGRVGPGVSRLASSLAELLGVQLLDGLAFARPVPTQKSVKTRAARRDNISGSLKSQGEVAAGTYFIIDDVATSGATMREGARALCAAGASATYGVAAGRDDSLEHLANIGVLHEVE